MAASVKHFVTATIEGAGGPVMTTVLAPGMRLAIICAVCSCAPPGTHNRCWFQTVPVTFSFSVLRPTTGMPAAIDFS